MDVGRTWRTPAKHDLMRSLIGKEVGVCSMKPGVRRCVWYDLTAGDAAAVEGHEWTNACSPGILANHARNLGKPVVVHLYEIKAATFDRLLENLSDRLPELGYRRAEERVWLHGEHVQLFAHNRSGAEASLSMITTGDAVFALNDPNAITEWAMRDSFAAEVSRLTWMFRSLSTLGCNPAGLKRLPQEERLGWFDLLRHHEAAAPRYRDLLLAAIERDDAQWAYLMGEPVKWRGQMEAVARSAFKRHGASMVTAWWRDQPAAYEALKRQLFLTKAERAA